MVGITTIVVTVILTMATWFTVKWTPAIIHFLLERQNRLAHQQKKKDAAAKGAITKQYRDKCVQRWEMLEMAVTKTESDADLAQLVRTIMNGTANTQPPLEIE